MNSAVAAEVGEALAKLPRDDGMGEAALREAAASRDGAREAEEDPSSWALLEKIARDLGVAMGPAELAA